MKSPATGQSACDDLREQLQSALGATYTIERELGGGGMSRVFLARDNGLNRQVVVKVVPIDGGLAAVERFRREITTAAQLQHPHIVPVLSAGDAAGVPYFTWVTWAVAATPLDTSWTASFRGSGGNLRGLSR